MKPLAIWCYWATMAGACGVSDLGMKEGQSTGNYSKHIKLMTGFHHPSFCGLAFATSVLP